MSYPTWKTYQALYARYLSKRPAASLVDLVNLNGKRVADLCGGSSDLWFYALQRGAKAIVVVDESSAMLSSLPERERLVSISMSVDDFLDNYRASKSVLPLDCVFCRQAVNYWLNEATSLKLAGCIGEGGFFVFNTFNTMPDTRPTVKEYDFEGHRFVETSQLIDGFVHHIQCRDGLAPHATKFRWISSEEFERLLSPHFDLNVEVDKRTSVYVCRRNSVQAK